MSPTLASLGLAAVRGSVVVALTLALAAVPARAQPSPGAARLLAAAPATGAKAAAAPAPAAPLEAVVHGLYIGTRFVGGYMVTGPKIPEGVTPAIAVGQPESYGTGTMLQLEVGYDITSALAIELVGGASLVNGTRGDWVRDLGITFGGAAVRLSPGITDRLRLVVTAGGGYASADNAVEKAEAGPAAFANVGLQYFVHVRHFSVGLDVAVLAPIQPLRVFVGLGPQVTYTF